MLLALADQVADPRVYVLARKAGTNVFRPRTEEHPEHDSLPGLVIVRPEGRAFFANAQRIETKMRALVDQARPKIVAMDLRALFDLEYTALEMLIEGEKRNHQQGIELWLVGLTPDVLAMIQRSSLGQRLGRAERGFAPRCYPGVPDTYDAARETPPRRAGPATSRACVAERGARPAKANAAAPSDADTRAGGRASRAARSR